MKRLLVIAFLLFVLPFSSRLALATNFLQNPGFEEGAENWTPRYKNAVVLSTVSDPLPNSGSLSLKIENKAKDIGWASQRIEEGISPGQSYLVSGFVMFTDTNVKEVKIRVAWYKPDDNNQLGYVDTNVVTSLTNSWSELQKVVTAPSQASKAEIRLVVAKVDDNSSAVAYFDDIFFQPDYSLIPAPSQVVATPTPTPTKAQGTGQTLGVSKQPTIENNLPKQVTDLNLADNSVLNVADSLPVLQLTATPSATESTQVLSVGKDKNSKTFLIMILAGVFLIAAVSVYFYWRRRTEKIA